VFSSSAQHVMQENTEHMMEQAPVNASSAQLERIPARRQDHALRVGTNGNPQQTKQGVLRVPEANTRQPILLLDVFSAGQEHIARPRM
jgi:hypothetical protein